MSELSDWPAEFLDARGREGFNVRALYVYRCTILEFERLRGIVPGARGGFELELTESSFSEPLRGPKQFSMGPSRHSPNESTPDGVTISLGARSR